VFLALAEGSPWAVPKWVLTRGQNPRLGYLTWERTEKPTGNTLMATPHDHLVSTDWLESHLDDDDLRIVDMRGCVVTRPLEPGVEHADYRGAAEEYLAAHIPGAVYIDWTRDIVDLDDPVPAQVAPPERFAEAMAERGIGDRTHMPGIRLAESSGTPGTRP